MTGASYSAGTLQTVLDALDAAVVGCDSAGRPMLFNNAARRLFGGLLDGVPLREWTQHVGLFDMDGNRLQAQDLSLLRALNGEHTRDRLVIMRAPRCSARVFRVHGRPVPHGQAMVAVAAMHEVTEQYRASQLQECELQISKLLSTPQPADTLITEAVALVGRSLQWSVTEFWAVDPVGQVLRRETRWSADDTDASGSAAAALAEGEGLPGQAWRDSVAVWSPQLHDDPCPGEDGGARSGAVAVPIPSGSATLGVLVCYSDAAEVPDDTRTAVLTGIAAHLGEFLERRRAEQFAAELQRIQDEYIALVGHELRTPLTTIQSYAEMLLADPELDLAERTTMLQVMQRNTDALHAIIAKLLDVAGLRSGHIRPHVQSIDLGELVDAAVTGARRTWPQALIEVNCEPGMTIDGDLRQMRRVLDELLGNAVTWSPPGSSVGVTAHADEHTAVISLANTGPQLTLEDRDRIFDLFFRTDAARHADTRGTGLGLTLARAVVERHHGNISVSEPDEAATTFTIRLPTHGA